MFTPDQTPDRTPEQAPDQAPPPLTSSSTAAPAELLSRSSLRGQGALAAVSLGSAIAILDGTVVNIALPTIGRQLDASLPQLQWVVNGYLLTLSALILVGGSLADRFGRRRIYLLGIGGFAVASGLCVAAQSPGQLIAARLVQGVAGALLTPGALAVISASFRREDRAAAIGQWAGVSGVATAAGPFLGGWILDQGGWRWIFAINIPLCVAVVVMCLVWVPESNDAEAPHRFDLRGAALAALALGAVTFAFTGGDGIPRIVLVALGIIGLGLAVTFVLVERRTDGALVPMTLFTNRIFSAANAMTLLVYGSLSAVLLLLVLQLQVTVGYSPLQSGVATLPMTIAIALLSSRAAALSARIGPRIPMSVGPLLAAGGVALLSTVGAGAGYWSGIFPGILLFSLGMSMLVSPLTATVLDAAPNRYAGVASGVNNAVARAGGLLMVAALPAVVGLSGDDYQSAEALTPGFRAGLLICAVLLLLGGLVSWVGLRAQPDRNGMPDLSTGTSA